jgi:hypothetical protein
MKELEFYKRAASDTAFRRAKLEDLRYFKQVGMGLIGFCVAVALAFSVYGGLTAGKWDTGFGMFGLAVLAASALHTCATRIAALQALDEQTT